MKIKVLFESRSRCDWLDVALADYDKRLPIEWVAAKDSKQLLALAKKERRVIGLDPGGKLMTSEEFADYFQREVEKGGARVTFVIGGPEGLPTALKEQTISLSPLTFTHQIARLVLAEQLYRALEIARGSPYHK